MIIISSWVVINVTFCKCKVYKLLIWYIYTLQYIYTSVVLANTSITSHNYHLFFNSENNFKISQYSTSWLTVRKQLTYIGFNKGEIVGLHKRRDYGRLNLGIQLCYQGPTVVLFCCCVLVLKRNAYILVECLSSAFGSFICTHAYWLNISFLIGSSLWQRVWDYSECIDHLKPTRRATLVHGRNKIEKV